MVHGFLAPQAGRHVAPIKVKFGTGLRVSIIDGDDSHKTMKVVTIFYSAIMMHAAVELWYRAVDSIVI